MEHERCENCDNNNNGLCEIWNAETDSDFACCVYYESQDTEAR